MVSGYRDPLSCVLYSRKIQGFESNKEEVGDEEVKTGKSTGVRDLGSCKYGRGIKRE